MRGLGVGFIFIIIFLLLLIIDYWFQSSRSDTLVHKTLRDVVAAYPDLFGTPIKRQNRWFFVHFLLLILCILGRESHTIHCDILPISSYSPPFKSAITSSIVGRSVFTRKRTMTKKNNKKLRKQTNSQQLKIAKTTTTQQKTNTNAPKEEKHEKSVAFVCLPCGCCCQHFSMISTNNGDACGEMGVRAAFVHTAIAASTFDVPGQGSELPTNSVNSTAYEKTSDLNE